MADEQPQPMPTGREALEEILAEHLATEHEYLDNMVPGYQWPQHPDDDGYRGDGGYARIIPKDVQEHRRDDARRILMLLAPYFASPATPPAQPMPAGREAPLPCPFCGRSPMIGEGSRTVQCVEDYAVCTAQVITRGATVEEAVARWNRRAAPATPPAQDVRAIIERCARTVEAQLCPAGDDEYMLGYHSAKRHSADAIRALSQRPPADAQGSFVCASRLYGTAGGNDPVDCSWPFCGCDPYADKVLTAIEECGFSLQRPADAHGATWRPTHRHKKRGTLYRVIGTATVQVTGSLTDESPVTVYEGEDGRLWCRPPVEFEDGRFEPLPAPPAAASQARGER